MNRRAFHLLAALSPLKLRATIAEPTLWSFELQANRLLLNYNQQLIANYVFNDNTIHRPYFMDLHTTGGTRITRHNPAVPTTEASDHATMHPGLWLAFGRLNGEDYWRNKAKIQHVRFLQSPVIKSNQIRFSVLNAYKSSTDDLKKPDLFEVAEFRWSRWTGGIMLDWNSTISSKTDPIKLGHQEEMGLGLRLSTPLCVKSGQGVLQNSAGGTNERGTWGKQAHWWAATMLSPEANNQALRTGIQVLAQNSNNLQFWGHTRDYGLIVANPTPRPDENKDEIELPIGTPLKMQFRILVFENIKLELEKWGDSKLPILADS
jgi:hypothetical protein